jgi:hypothetical protein
VLLATTAANAEPVFSDRLSGGYEYIDAAGTSANAWGAQNQGLISFALPGFNLQLDLAETRTQSSGFSIDDFHGAFSGFWRSAFGTIGATFAHESSSGVSVSSYGAFAEWYAAPKLTFRLKGGGGDGSIFGLAALSSSGGYGGAGVGYYPNRNVEVSLDYTYLTTSGVDVQSYGGALRWQFDTSLPLSMNLGYQHLSSNAGVDGNEVMFSLSYRYGAPGSLLRSDRMGPVDWTAAL